MLAMMSLALAASPLAIQNSKVLALRGGMSLGPINSGNFESSLKVCAAITAAGAITSKYADLDGTTLTKTFKGGVWNSNLIISMITGVTSTVIYSVGGSAFDGAQLTAALWLFSAIMDFKDSGFDINSLTENKVQTGIAALATYLAFA